MLADNRPMVPCLVTPDLIIGFTILNRLPSLDAFYSCPSLSYYLLLYLVPKTYR